MNDVYLADTPGTWADPASMSTLHAVLFFVGIPLLIVSVITLLVMAPSLAKGPRYRPSQQWEAEAEWFGAPPVEGGESEHPALESGDTSGAPSEAAPTAHAGAATGRHRSADDAGGASASW